MSKYDEAIEILTQRFARDSLISVATVHENRPYVRTVDGYYENGAFYTVTYALSNKIKHIQDAPEVAICGEWFTGHGIGENLGHVGKPSNASVMDTLREAFAAWYSNGHTDESDPNTCLLRITLTDGILFNNGTRYVMDFTNHVVEE